MLMMQRMVTRLLFGSALAMVPATGSAQTAAAPDSAIVRAGKTLYEGRGLCASCHGKNGEGILGPTLRLNAGKKAWLHTDGSLRSIVVLIKSGLEPSVTESGITMPARGGARLTDEQVEQVAAYVVHLHQSAPAPSSP